MRMLTGIALFLLTLFLGLQAVTLARLSVAELSLPAGIDVVAANEELEAAELPRGVRITYNGIFPASSKEHPAILRFLIYNGTRETLTCVGYSGTCASPEIRVRGLDAAAWVCMNGSSDYTIKTGESAELMVDVQDFQLLPGKTDDVMIGYKFEHSEGSSDQYFAEPIVLPVEFRKALIKHFKELRDLEAGIY